MCCLTDGAVDPVVCSAHGAESRSLRRPWTMLVMVEKPDPEHVVRGNSFPWRPPEDGLTECGLEVTGRKVITKDELVQKERVQGKTRAAMTTCITCAQTATRYRSWDQDPVDAVRREVLGMRRHEQRFKRELWALAALAAAHPEQFQGFLSGLEQTTDLVARRRAKRNVQFGR